MNPPGSLAKTVLLEEIYTLRIWAHFPLLIHTVFQLLAKLAFKELWAGMPERGENGNKQHLPFAWGVGGTKVPLLICYSLLFKCNTIGYNGTA